MAKTATMNACKRVAKCTYSRNDSLCLRHCPWLGSIYTDLNSNISSDEFSEEGALTLSIVSEAAQSTQDGGAEGKQSDIPETAEAESASTPASNEKAAPKKTSKKTQDPLRWFGILVPPALRSAQQTFVSAVEESIPRLATIARDLRNQEIEIGRVRKQIKKL